MTLNDEQLRNLRAGEDALSREADTLEQVLYHLGDRLPHSLIGGAFRQQLMLQAREIPSSAAILPFGFELPLNCREARADLGISLGGGTRTAAHYEHQGRSGAATAAQAGLASLLQSTGSKLSMVQQMTARQVVLEYDIDTNQQNNSSAAPGVFIRPSPLSLLGGLGLSKEVATLTDAIVAVAGWGLDTAEKQQAIGVYEALDHHQRIESFGIFPSRKRGVRLAVKGFKNSSEIVQFLSRANWSVQHRSTIQSTVDYFVDDTAIADLGINIDVYASGIGPRLGLSFATKTKSPDHPQFWFDEPQQWKNFLLCLKEGNYAVPEKHSALTRWTPTPELLFGRSVALNFVRGIHHFKFVVLNNQVTEVKAYIYCMLFPRSSTSLLPDPV